MSDNQEFRDRFPDHEGAPGRDLDREHADDPRMPTTNQPLNAEPRSRWLPALAVLALIVVIVLVFAGITWLRYNT